MIAPKLLCGLVLAAGVAGLAGSAYGQVAPRQESPLVGARKQVLDAQTAFNAAKAQYDVAKLKVTGTYKTTNPDYAKAEADATKAKQEVEAAKLAAQAAAKKKPEYLAAATAKAKAQEEIRTANQAGGQPDAALGGTIATQAGVMNRIEAQALESDPKYLEAKDKYAEAMKALDVFKTQLDEAYKVDPECQTAMQTVTQAQQALTQAQDSMKQMVKAEADRRSAESKARSEANKAKSSAGK